MVEFLGTEEVNSRIKRIIRNAKEKIVLISPYIQINQKLIQLLEHKTDLQMGIRFICRRDALKPEEEKKILSLKNVRLNFCENLHAKCYFNEKEAVVGSMNLYMHSQNNNYEMGFYFNKSEDGDIFQDFLIETKDILNASSETEESSEKVSETKGYCIRCAKTIPYDPFKPLCKDCYAIWSKYEDTEYPEGFCHKCGNHLYITTFERPLCLPCYQGKK